MASSPLIWRTYLTDGKTSKLSDGVTGNTTDFGSVESRFDS